LTTAFWKNHENYATTEIVCLEEQHNHDGWSANSWQISNFSVFTTKCCSQQTLILV
jgi:hypothetical protein